MSYLGDMGGAQPAFYGADGNPAQQIQCGTPYTFDVPGFSPGNIWLEQTHNGAPSFSGVFPVPMPSYVSDCVSQVGTYLNSVYTITPQGTRGQYIGSVQVKILPGQLPQGVIPTDVLQATPAGVMGLFSTIPMWGWLALGAGAFFFMGGKKSRSSAGAGAGGGGGDLGL